MPGLLSTGAMASSWARLSLRTCAPLAGPFRRFHFGVDNWEEDSLKKIEQKWRKGDRIRKALPGTDSSQKPFYVLSMFPYPSGHLHMGHVRVYAISDALAHFHRMRRGAAVVHPMGWDAFGLPAENAAIERRVRPQDWTAKNIESMRAQLDKLGCCFDWEERELSTCHPGYYKWTQVFFVKLMEAGLAYQREAVVNWDPVDQTVLADEQVDETGRSWRSGALVEKRPLRQWFLRTTAFSEALYDGLSDPSLHNWRDIIKMQQNWIGECTGTRLLLETTEPGSDHLEIWTDVPGKLHQARFVSLAKDHLLDRPELVEHEVKSSVLGGRGVTVLKQRAVHPFSNKAELPIFVFESPDDLPHPDCDAYLGTHELGEALLAELGLNVANASATDFPVMSREEVLEEAKRRKIGGHLCGPKLKDWLVSRQRYWGTPIPVVHCQGECGAVPVQEDQLPVELPEMDRLSSRGASPLLEAEDWIQTTCPKCGGPARRETDTMDTFVDSSWYFLRYLDPRNEERSVDPDKAKAMPVDIYIGGKEHATLHLYYARFFTHFLHSIGVSPVKEPFRSLLVQGMVKGKSYRVKGTGQYLRPDQVEFPKDEKGKPVEKDGERRPLVVEWEKMSKSKHNGVDPNEVLDRYGSDTVKMMMLSGVGPASDRNWSEESYPRIRNLQIRLLKLVSLAVTLDKESLPPLDEARMSQQREKLWDARNYYLKSINHSYTLTHNLAVVLARVESLVKDLWAAPGQAKRDLPEYRRCLATAIVALAPVAPHLSAELWEGLSPVYAGKDGVDKEFRWGEPVFRQPWPKLEQHYNLKVSVRVGDDEVASLPVPVSRMGGLTEEEALEMARADPRVQAQVLRHQHSHTFTKFPDYDATLEFSVIYPELTQEEKLALKQKKKEDKARKKEERERRILERQRAEERKKTKMQKSTTT